MKLTKEQIADVLHEHAIHHTPECRTHNPRKQPGGHPTPCPMLPVETQTMFGGYHCICDWKARVVEKHVEMTS